MKPVILILGTVCMMFLLPCSCSSPMAKADNQIKPWTENPRYWQYKDEPVLLLGATGNDNLFQNDNLESHLDSLSMFGGNYVRNTMSDRDPGNIRAFMSVAPDKYDLEKWNGEYWQRFENLLRLASERDIIVQIEIWDRFDHSREPWLGDPYNPKNNINYSYAEAGLDTIYPLHPGQNKQPFFFTVPELQNNTVLLKYQENFVKKLLSISLRYDNVLYCIDNETSGVEEWASYWAGFIRENSGGKEINLTQMWDNWDVKSEVHKRTLDHPERYSYIDISQNSQIPGQPNWDNAQYVFDYIKNSPRPVNSTKIYGSDQGSWLDRGITTKHAVETFCRNVTGGFASSRFHRPPSGLGLSRTSINCLLTIRKIEEKVKFRDLTPMMNLLETTGENKTFLSAKEGENYVLYFTGPGTAILDLGKWDKTFELNWIPIEKADWDNEGRINGGGRAEITSGYPGDAFAVMTVVK
ncbi:MAG TPA: hypothetical protein PK106_07585 [Bacteroidales bacterium]|nr:hypothetical protein [Bacteroidales bacterium]